MKKLDLGHLVMFFFDYVFISLYASKENFLARAWKKNGPTTGKQERHVGICTFYLVCHHGECNGSNFDMTFENHKYELLVGHYCRQNNFGPCYHEQLAYDSNTWTHNNHKSGFCSRSKCSCICHDPQHGIEGLGLERLRFPRKLVEAHWLTIGMGDLSCDCCIALRCCTHCYYKGNKNFLGTPSYSDASCCLMVYDGSILLSACLVQWSQRGLSVAW